jgi:hypothetical protein
MSEAPKKSNPQLLDRVVGEIQDALIAGLPWLNFAFGIAERLVHEINGKEYYLPNVYRAENDYIEISPDDKDLHNHSFFTVDEPQYLDCVRGQKMKCVQIAALSCGWICAALSRRTSETKNW